MKPLDPLSRSLLEDARADAPPLGAENRIWQTVSQQLQAPLPPTAAAASRAITLKTSASLLTAPLLKLAAVAVIASTAGIWVSSRSPAHMPASPPRAAQLRETVKTPSAPVEAQPAAPSAPPPAAEPASTLEVETQLLAEAQRALGRGDPKQALNLVNLHASRFPQGKLAQTRDAARVLALCGLQRTRAAQRAQRQFLSDWPSSPLKSRVLNACPAAKHTEPTGAL